ncbi:MAG: hypothetical protein ACOYOJ_11645 [Alsobacter sp.]
MEQLKPEVIKQGIRALVRLRIEREGGDGTYEQMIKTIAEGGAQSAGLQKALDRAYERAERNVRDVLAVLGIPVSRT